MSKRQSSPLFFLLFSLFSFLLLSSCADMFQDKIPMSSKNDTLDNFFARSNDDEIVQLGTPAQFYVAQYFSSSEIRLTWSEVRGAMYYMVERAVSENGEEPDSGDYEPLERFVYGTSYIDAVLRETRLDAPEFGNRYFYRVSAFNSAKNFDASEPTLPQSAMLFRAPGNTRASGGESEEHIMVQWAASPGAESYEVYRSPLANGTSASLLASVPGNQTWYRNMIYTAEQGMDFYYMIIAKNSFGNRTPQTRPAYGYSKVFGAPEAPENVRLAPNSGRGNSINNISIVWDAVDEPEAYYAVYRYSEVDSSLTRLAGKLEKPAPDATTMTYTDSQGLRPGVYYYYRIQAILEDVAAGGRELKSPFSEENMVNGRLAAEGFLLSSPDEVIAEKSSTGAVTVKWRPAKGRDERQGYTYNVFQGRTLDGDFVPVVTQVLPNAGADGYISAGVPSVDAGTFFRVSTVNGSVESGRSVVVSPSPAKAIIQDASKYANTTTSANSNGVYPVKITWRKPEGEDPAFYSIQRSTRSGSGFARINDASLGADGPWSDLYSRDPATGVYTYIDNNESARVGRKFYYRVLSLNSLEQGSFPSDERIGWGALTHTQYLLEYNKTMSAALKKLTLMWKSGNTDKLGTETKYGTLGGSIYYNAAIDGLGARIIIRVDNYADFYIENVPENGTYFTLNGNSNTSANMSSNGSMDGTVTCTGMYPGRVYYDRVEIKGGAAGGGTYGVEPEGFPRVEVIYTVIN